MANRETYNKIYSDSIRDKENFNKAVNELTKIEILELFEVMYMYDGIHALNKIKNALK